ncbi:hypothetical protein COF68_06360 [Bacillus toyonensis]|uniref:hypothetical protein n=1 Tax=Bacillus toyonensis TaxID=155322 RepID=UPI000BFE6BEF|nr:hypothetical protein [Bacillus toyonensis]PHE64457.1 hypothetical protein COF68_06360 [Bacillus toyonensis]
MYKTREKLFEDLKELSHKVDFLSSIVQNGGDIPKEELDLWVNNIDTVMFRLTTIKKQVVEYVTSTEETDMDGLLEAIRDCLLALTNKVEPTVENLELIARNVPNSVKEPALKYGWADLDVRDDLFLWLRDNMKVNNEKI